MSWAKLDDKLHEDPRYLGLDAHAIALDYFANSYSARVESDGLIPRERVPILAAVFNVGKARALRLADLLVAREIWEKARNSSGEPSGNYVIREFLTRNPSHAELGDRRAKEAEKKRNQRAANLPYDRGDLGRSAMDDLT